MATIESFSGAYRWLSNFYPCKVTLDGVAYRSVEHAYQAAKTLDGAQRRMIATAYSPGEAKRIGRRITMRADWETVKLDVMRSLVREKFTDSAMRQRLEATRPDTLIEGNTWGDRFWGVCGGSGCNWLGKILMEVRG